MIKLQFSNTIHNLLTNSQMEKLCHFLLFNSLALYKVMTYSGNASQPIKLIGNVSSIPSRDSSIKVFLVCTLHIRDLIKISMSSIVYFYQQQALVQVSIPFHMWKLRHHSLCTPPSPQTVYVYRAHGMKG